MGRLKAHLHICVVGNMSTNIINDYGHKKKLVDFIVFFFLLYHLTLEESLIVSMMLLLYVKM